MFHLLKKKKGKADFLAPMSGRIMDVSQAPDPVFSEKMMGDGFAIELSGDSVIAPFDAEVVSAFPTGHAFGLKSADGTELLIHIGMDTVQLDGKGFTVQAAQGTQVKQGDCLVKVDVSAIKAAGKSLVSPVIFTAGTPFTLLKKDELIESGDPDILTLG